MLGAFGLSSAEHIAKAMQASGVTVRPELVENLEQQYQALIAKGYKRPVFTGNALDASGAQLMVALASETGVPTSSVRAFLLALQTLAVKAEIPRQLYDPVGVQKAKKLAARYEADRPRSALDKIGDAASAAAKTTRTVVIGAAVIAVAALVFVYLPKPRRG